MFRELTSNTRYITLGRMVTSIGFSSTIPFLALYLAVQRETPLFIVGIMYLLRDSIISIPGYSWLRSRLLGAEEDTGIRIHLWIWLINIYGPAIAIQCINFAHNIHLSTLFSSQRIFYAGTGRTPCRREY